MSEQVKGLNGFTEITSIASGSRILVSDSAGKGQRISLPNLKAALMGGLDLNALEDGIFVMFHRKSDNLPNIVKPHKWTSYQTSGEIAGGVVVVEGGKVLVVAPTESTRLSWSSANIVAGETIAPDTLTAFSDFNGKGNTTEQVKRSECSGTGYAPGFCKAYSRANANGQGLTAGKWWLPSMGELMMIYANMTKINYALSLIAGAMPLSEGEYWTSTEYSATFVWTIQFNNGSLYTTSTKAAGRGRVRPVSEVIL